MANLQQLSPVQRDSLRYLNEAEIRALDRYQGYPLSPDAATRLYGLFLAGFTTAEIRAQNPGMELGCIVRARVDNGWDERRRQYLDELLGGFRSRLEQVQAEAVRFACDALAAYHKLEGQRFRQYLQSGDPRDLGDWQSMTLKEYRDIVDTTLKLTGQDVSKLQAAVVVQQVPEQAAARPVTATEAQDLVKKLLEARRDEEKTSG